MEKGTRADTIFQKQKISSTEEKKKQIPSEFLTR